MTTLPVIPFAKLESGMPMPHLLDIQTHSFRTLLEPEAIGVGADLGLERVFNDVFPITDVNGNYSLEFVKFALGEPKYTVEECIERDMTYSASLKATLRLVVLEEMEGGARRPKNIIEKEVYLGELPILTPLGTFVINGAERVVVSQLHRSPGVVFEETTHPNGQRLYSSRIIPFRGSWVEFTVDIHDVVYVHIDKKKKFPATALLRAFGYGSNADILRLFYATRELDLSHKLEERMVRRQLLGSLVAEDVAAPDGDGFLAREGDELTSERHEALKKAGIKTARVFARYTTVDIRDEERPTSMRDAEERQVLAFDVPDPDTGEVLVEAGKELTETTKKKLIKAGAYKVDVLLGAVRNESQLIKNTLAKDPTASEAEALEQIYALLRPGDAPNLETARAALERLFFNPKRYDLGRVGRYKINQRLKVKVPYTHTVLTEDDFVAIVRYLLELSEGRGHTDDIDHLGNRRVRTVGELIANQFSVGLSRMARLVRERMSINNDPEKITLDDLVNARTVSAVIQAFFGSSQLSQFMDQTNPLAELTHKRRLSALGPGGLTRERAGFEVRDVHYSQYGRMCPIETPEGPNIGLITSLSTYARVNELGFIETPYHVVKDGRITQEVRWLSASEEEEFAVAQANAPLDAEGRFIRDLVLCRKRDDYPLLAPARIEFMDVAPEQLVSIAAALIPFLEHDDANRALMGSNMQRQSVPLLFPQAPLVGTGLEAKVAMDSGAVVVARRGGLVSKVTADEIIVDTGREGVEEGGEAPLRGLMQHDRYRLKKFWRTNQDTAINQRPLVQVGQQVDAGQVIADGPATENGELALGANVLVAFMPWYGHNFEDAIVLSERLVKDDVYSSIHIQELELHVRDTKRGKEEITREIPNVSEEALVDLDERGIVRIGAHVTPGDILVGKITPKGETELSPEEKLLTAIFGEKAKDVKDSSLKVPPGMAGVVIDVKIFSRIEDQVVEKDRGERIGEVRRLENEEKKRISDVLFEEMRDLLQGQEVVVMLRNGTVDEYQSEGTKLTKAMLAEVDFADVDLKTLRVSNKAINERIRTAIDAANRERARIEEKAEDQIDKILQPDELPPGVIQLVKVYLAEKRKISVGDKMAGRHGNKGIIARIVPEEDMPFMPDGTPVDIVLNPLGVPSRMNVGQLLETHLGWAARLLGFEAKTPVFQGADELEIGLLLRLAGLVWARDAMSIESELPSLSADALKQLVEDLKRLRDEGGEPPVIQGVELDMLQSRTLSQETRDLFHGIRDFLEQAAKDLVERHKEEARVQVTDHEQRAEDEDLEKARKVALRHGLKDAEKIAGMTQQEALEHVGLPALAKLLGPKSEANVEEAAAEFLREAGLTPTGKMRLRDGRNGEWFDSDVTVGSIYMMKLSHLVDDKIHARSIGPYSLVTQQPLAGKAQFGGQRFGEMEVWALEAYGAAHVLQEMLTVKSDDVNGRSRVYEAIVKGQNLPEPGIPESFNVLVKELQSLGLRVTLGATEDGEE